MGDLISRSAYKKKLEDYSKHLAIRYDKANSEGDYEEINAVNNECYAFTMFKSMLDNMPTTTEAEIRAKAIEEFAEKMKELFKHIKVADSVIDMVVKEMKGE